MNISGYRNLCCLLGLIFVGLLARQSLFPAEAQSCTFALGSTGQSFAAGAGLGSVRVTASQPACNWTATSNAPWINITAGAAGTGNSSVGYTVAANPAAAPRNGTLTVAGQTFTVTQDAGLAGLQFFPLPAPVRLLETRAGFTGCLTPGAPINTNSTFTLPAQGACSGIPAQAAAVTGNITVVPQGAGFLTLFPSSAGQPTVANSNFGVGEITNNVFTVGLGNDGAFKIFSSATTHVIVDVTGYYAPPAATGLYFHSLPAPVRLLETRGGFSGCFAQGAPLNGTGNPNADPNLDLAVQGRSPLPTACNSIPASARVLVGNATSVLPGGGGYLTIYPNGGSRPLIASSNYAGNDVINGPFAVKLGADGKFKVYTLTTTDLVLDVLGYYSEEAVDANGAGLLFTPLPAPVRLLETRPGGPPLTGCTRTNAPIAGNVNAATHTQPARNFCGLPASAQAVVGNASVVNSGGAGFLTLFPGNLTTAPLVATSNYTAPATFGYNRHYFVALSPADGTFKVLTQFTTDLVLDASGYFAPVPTNQAPLVAAGADQTLMLPNLTASLTGAAGDDGLPNGSLSLSWSRVSGPGTVIFSQPNQAATDATFSGQGVYVLRLTAGDGALSASDDVQITVTGGSLSVNASADQVVTLPNTALIPGMVNGGMGSVNIAWSIVSGPETVIFSNASAAITDAIFRTAGVYVLRLTATDGQTTLNDDVQVTVNADPTPPPPDPAMVAPPLDLTVATTIGDATEFLYSGANPIQTGVAPGMINKTRVAVLKGRVLDKNNQPLSLVKITVLDHPEFGRTLSRADGRFDLAVNGGGVLTVNYEKLGYLPVQRCETVPWQDYCGVPDVVMIGFDANVTRIDLLAATPIQVARGGVMTDTSGTRRATLLFKQGTTATMKLPGGVLAGLDKLHVRATEFTTGANGPAAMPGELPPNSAYTYAADFNVDEAVAANATEVTFNQPVLQYNENFLNFPIGTVVPSGSYDQARGIWIVAESGRVVKILSVTANTANLDLDGSGQPATDPQYAALGITVAERQTLATLYTVNQSLWRVPLNHFSSWDSNWAFGPPSDAEPWKQFDLLKLRIKSLNRPTECDGCTLEVENQALGEAVGIVGTPFNLNYRSSLQAGSKSLYTVPIPLSGATTPASLKRIELEVTIAGRSFTQTFPATPNQTTTFTWDGKDAYGRTVQGRQTAVLDIGYVYDGVYQNTGNFGYNGNGIPITGSMTRQEVTLHARHSISLGTFDVRRQSLGGWTLGVHHVYDPVGKVLYQGDGAQRSVENINAITTTAAGTGVQGFSGDGGQATQAMLRDPQGVAVAPDGSIYIADTTNGRIRKVAPDGVITTAATTPQPRYVLVMPDGSLITNGSCPNCQIIKIAPNGQVTSLAGIAGQFGFSGDDGPATQARFNGPRPYLASDGSLYISDIFNHRIRKVGTDGIVRTIAGNGVFGFSGDGGPATQASLDRPTGLVVAPDGTLYFMDALNNRIRKIGTDGIITTFAGTGIAGTTGDGGPALLSQFNFGLSSSVSQGALALGADGALYVSQQADNNTDYSRIRRIDPNGTVTNVAGTGVAGGSNEGTPAVQGNLTMRTFNIGPDGSLYPVGFDFTATGNHKVRRISPPLSGFTGNELAIPAEDGAQLFKFDSAGRHLQTLNALTGAVVYSFTYDSAGRLIRVTDGDNNITEIERNGAGNPTGILSPYNQRTMLQLDANGYLNRITDPAGQFTQFTYTAQGMLTAKTDPRGNSNQFTYDALGRLIRDDDAATGFQTLARTDLSGNYQVLRNTALNRQSNYQVQQLSTGDRKRITTAPNNLNTELIERQSGVQELRPPDGTVDTQTLGPDPRWQMRAPLTTSSAFTTPGGLNFGTLFTRTVTLSNPADPLSLTAQNDTLSVNGRNFTSNYNGLTRTFTDATPLNRQSTSTIDTQGRVTAAQFANFNAGAYSYDARGRLINATFGSGVESRTTAYSYNAAGFLASLTDALNRMTSFSYDLAGRVTQQTLPDARVIGFAHDANGNLTALTPPGRPAHAFTYNAVDLVSSYTPPVVPGTGATQYAYNLDRQLATITRPDALTLNFSYDAAGRLGTLTVPNGAYTYAYSGTTGNPTGITAPGGGTLTFLYDGSLLMRETWAGTVAGNVSRTLDNNLRVTSQSINSANTVNFTYDNDDLLTGAGAITLARHAQNGLITGTTLSNVTDTRGYNGFGELASYSASFNATPLYATTYTRDKLGRITQKVETLGGTTTTYDYSYDTAGRLMEVKLDNVTASTYTYDSNDNRLSRTTSGGTVNGTYDAQDRLTAYGTATYSYTANGELQSKTVGVMTTNYSYDVMGNLRSVTLPDGTLIEYLIDGADRRIGKRINGVLTQGWLYQNQLKPVAELDGGNNIVSRFVYGSNFNVPDYLIKAGVTYRLITDHLGSVRLVVNVATGAIAQRLDYDEFGVVTMDTAPGFQPFGFAGGLYDAQTKLARYGARDYDAETGRWTAKDPILFANGDSNLYAYVGNNPIAFIDPAGLQPVARPVTALPTINLPGPLPPGPGEGLGGVNSGGIESIGPDDVPLPPNTGGDGGPKPGPRPENEIGGPPLTGGGTPPSKPEGEKATSKTFPPRQEDLSKPLPPQIISGKGGCRRAVPRPPRR